MAKLKATVEVLGLEELKKSLHLLSKTGAKRAIRKAMRAGTNKMLAATKENAPVDTGLMKKSLVVRALKRKRGRIGFRIGFKNVHELLAKSNNTTVEEEAKAKLSSHIKGKKRHFYPAVVEYGSQNHEPNPFMRSAFERHKDESKRTITEVAHREIEAEMKKPLKK